MEKHKEKRRRWTLEIATAELGRWRDSGLSAGEYARRRGIDPQRLYWWARRVEAPPGEAAPGFTEIILAPAASGDGARGGVVIHLRSGHRIMVEPSFDAEVLRRVVAVLAEEHLC